MVVDSDFLMRGHVADSLESEGIAVLEADNKDEVFRLLGKTQVDVVFADLSTIKPMGRHAGRAMSDSRIAWVVMTSFGTVDQAIDLVKNEGAYDYLVKPFSAAQVSVTLARLREVLRLREQVNELEQQIRQSSGRDAVPEPLRIAALLPSSSTSNLQELERETILRVMQETAGCRGTMAERLGISVRTLRNKLNQYRECAGENGPEELVPSGLYLR